MWTWTTCGRRLPNWSGNWPDRATREQLTPPTDTWGVRRGEKAKPRHHLSGTGARTYSEAGDGTRTRDP